MFGRNLRRRARELSLSDAEVARRAGINERRYGFYVTGDREPDLMTLVRIASVLQTSVDDLLTGSDEERGTEAISREAGLLSVAQALSDDHFTLLIRTAEAFTLHQREHGSGSAKAQNKKSRKNN